MIGQFVMSVIAYLFAKRIAERWGGVWKCFIGYFAAFIFAWACGGILGGLLEGVPRDGGLALYAGGFWWVLFGMMFGIYKGKKARKIAIHQEISPVTNERN